MSRGYTQVHGCIWDLGLVSGRMISDRQCVDQKHMQRLSHARSLAALNDTPKKNMAGTPAATLLGVTASLYFLIFCSFGGRIYNRVKQKRFRWEDYSITLATVSLMLMRQ